MATQQLIDALGFDLEEGVYVLTEDVVNPEADRRVRNLFEAIPVFKRGLLLYVHLYMHSEYQLPCISCEKELHGRVVVSKDNVKQWKALVAAMKPAPKHLGRALIELSKEGGIDDCKMLLAGLIDEGVISYEKILELGKRLGDEIPDDVEAYNSWRAKRGI